MYFPFTFSMKRYTVENLNLLKNATIKPSTFLPLFNSLFVPSRNSFSPQIMKKQLRKWKCYAIKSYFQIFNNAVLMAVMAKPNTGQKNLTLIKAVLGTILL